MIRRAARSAAELARLLWCARSRSQWILAFLMMQTPATLEEIAEAAYGDLRPSRAVLAVARWQLSRLERRDRVYRYVGNRWGYAGR